MVLYIWKIYFCVSGITSMSIDWKPKYRARKPNGLWFPWNNVRFHTHLFCKGVMFYLCYLYYLRIIYQYGAQHAFLISQCSCRWKVTEFTAYRPGGPEFTPVFSGVSTAYRPGGPEFTPVLSGVVVAQSLVLCIVFSRSLFVPFSLFTIVLSIIFVVIYHCVVCHFCRYLPLCCLTFLSLFTIVLSVLRVIIYHCVVCPFCSYLPLCCLTFLSLFTIVLSVIFVVIYHCVVCHFCRYLPLYCQSFLSLSTIVLSVIFVVIYHCVVCHFCR